MLWIKKPGSPYFFVLPVVSLPADTRTRRVLSHTHSAGPAFSGMALGKDLPLSGQRERGVSDFSRQPDAVLAHASNCLSDDNRMAALLGLDEYVQ